MSSPFSLPLKLSRFSKAETFELAPDEAQRRAIGAGLGLLGLPEFTARLTAKPWLDGLEITGRLIATVTYECGVTLDPFDSEIDEDFTLRVLPAGSPHAATDEKDLAVDFEADDPPDVLDGDDIDLAAVAVEHLALALDPYPRKPDAVFEAPPVSEELSPFAALKALKTKDEG
ncbi:MAG: DUF177 domain-containing protein [Caulobacteraceae bacterium]